LEETGDDVHLFSVAHVDNGHADWGAVGFIVGVFAAGVDFWFGFVEAGGGVVVGVGEEGFGGGGTGGSGRLEGGEVAGG